MLIQNATSDLEERVRGIDNNVQGLSSLDGHGSVAAVEQQKLREKLDSTENNLEICPDVFAHTNQVQTEGVQLISTPPGAFEQRVSSVAFSAQRITATSLQACKTTIASTTSQLQRHLEDINVGLRSTASDKAGLLEDQIQGCDKIRAEMRSVQQCLDICAQASEQAYHHRTTVVEDVSIAEDGLQVIDTTLGNLISIRGVPTRAWSAQLVGMISDASLRQLARNRYG